MRTSVYHRSVSEPKPPAVIIACPRSPKPVLSPTVPAEFRLHMADEASVTPDSIAKAKAAQHAARAEFLTYIADPTARARYEATFAAEEAEAEARAIERMADAISQHRFSCPTLCLPTETRTKVFALAKYGVELLDLEG